jgi:hypothetical protein
LFSRELIVPGCRSGERQPASAANLKLRPAGPSNRKGRASAVSVLIPKLAGVFAARQVPSAGGIDELSKTAERWARSKL